MKLPDVNVLLYALDSASPRHDDARPWLEELLSGRETVAFGWSVLLGVVRLTSRPVIFERPLTPSEALDLVDGWLARPNATTVHPTSRHTTILRELLEPWWADPMCWSTQRHLHTFAPERRPRGPDHDPVTRRLTSV